MSSSIPIQIAETIQTASIKRNPDVAYDLNPSTAASSKQPVTTSPYAPSSDGSHEVDTFDEVDGVDDDDEEEEEEDIPYHVIRPLPRKPTMPPLPDLRFEQSYLASIAQADTYFQVAFITIRDQVLFPLGQGVIWTLALAGWRYYNRNVLLHGSSVGSRIRRWWWRTNNWPIEGEKKGLMRSGEYAEQVGDYYKNKLGAGGD